MRNLPLRRCARGRGYTLIELIIVIALLGIAGAMVLPHLVGRDLMNAQATVRMLISDMSFAQSDALANQEFRRVYFYDDGRGYCIVRVTEATFDDVFDPAVADYITDPLRPGTGYIVDFVADERFEGVSITAASLDGGSRFLTYDQIGGTVMTGEAPGLGGSITVASGTESYQITVSPFTGKLTVN